MDSAACVQNRVTTELAVQHKSGNSRVSPTSRIGANDGSEQVSTVKRRSASGDGVDALNTRTTTTDLGALRGTVASRNFSRTVEARRGFLAKNVEKT